VQIVAGIRNMSYEEVAEITYNNAMKVFNLQEMKSDGIFKVMTNNFMTSVDPVSIIDSLVKKSIVFFGCDSWN
jgi:hypothetical protein